jgi:uncharacterized membrane protein YdjX (TVP38/TMEM64 family)
VTDDDTPAEPDTAEGIDDSGSVFRSQSHRRRALAAFSGVCAAMLLSGGVLWWVGPGALDPSWLRERLAALGPLAPLAFVCLQALQVVVAPIPGQVLAGVGGYLFGSRLGTLYSMLGVVLGSTVVFVASQRYGRPFVERVLAPETLTRFDGFVAEYGTVGLFVAFLLPAFPDDALCALAGLTQLDYRRFLFLLVVGRTPTFLAAAVAGTSAASGDLAEAGLVIAGLATASAVVYYFRERLSSALAPLTDRGG